MPYTELEFLKSAEQNETKHFVQVNYMSNKSFEEMLNYCTISKFFYWCVKSYKFSYKWPNVSILLHEQTNKSNIDRTN